MNELNNKKYQCLSGSALKIIALVTMIIDHIGSVLLRHIPWAVEPLFSVGSQQFDWYAISRCIGRIAFPIYCFLLVEGFIHTQNRKRYGINLLVFAIISEIPWNLEHTGKFTYEMQNVFFTLFFGYLGLCLYEKFKGDTVKQSLCLISVFAVSAVFKADYGIIGYCFILAMYFLRDKKIPQALICSCFEARWYMLLLSFVPIIMYNGKRGFIKGRVLKYVFYAAYPVHILILYFIRLKYFGYE